MFYAIYDALGEGMVFQSTSDPQPTKIHGFYDGFYLPGYGEFFYFRGPYVYYLEAKQMADLNYHEQNIIQILPDTEPTMLTGKDYPELCEACRKAIDTCAMLIESSGIDYDHEDNEVACNMAYDMRMFCGQFECVNKPLKDYESGTVKCFNCEKETRYGIMDMVGNTVCSQKCADKRNSQIQVGC